MLVCKFEGMKAHMHESATILRLDSPVHRTQPRIAIGPYIVHAPGIPRNFLSNLRRIAHESSPLFILMACFFVTYSISDN